MVAAREQAKKNGSTRKRTPKRRTGQVVRRDGREPLGLGTAITWMMTERGMVAPAAAGGGVLAQWDGILAAAARELTGHARAVKFDADTGRLEVVPDAPAYGTKLRWSAPKLIAVANAEVPDVNVHTLHVLPPAPGDAGPASAPAEADPRPVFPGRSRVSRMLAGRRWCGSGPGQSCCRTEQTMTPTAPGDPKCAPTPLPASPAVVPSASPPRS
ncbi:DUF721 domain-containing protein [Streptomyces sp. 110]|uniref:DUF721 domain-containing protein n=1 Tax=Streptomyces endocoffeicus TaxID=2898945 RepID=A0ABS1Q874_9ACTN|nr:DUF721 domain-containing protein [Streptomyces endocoffeicus]